VIPTAEQNRVVRSSGFTACTELQLPEHRLLCIVSTVSYNTSNTSFNRKRWGAKAFIHRGFRLLSPVYTPHPSSLSFANVYCRVSAPPWGIRETSATRTLPISHETATGFIKASGAYGWRSHWACVDTFLKPIISAPQEVPYSPEVQLICTWRDVQPAGNNNPSKGVMVMVRWWWGVSCFYSVRRHPYNPLVTYILYCTPPPIHQPTSNNNSDTSRFYPLDHHPYSYQSVR